MRKLLYIPIIHSEADLGSLGPAVAQRSASLLGQEQWARHRETVARFWKSIAEYLLSLGGAGLKIYQDGLAAEGELGRRVIEEAARRGSVNHHIILRLLSQGAEVRKTEDPSLLLQEYENLSHLAEGELAQHHSHRLTRERDKFIARTINETLKEGETAVLFLGAYHNVLSRLDQDIEVEKVKDPDKVKAYFNELVSGKAEKKLRRLAEYLASLVAGPHIRESAQ